MRSSGRQITATQSPLSKYRSDEICTHKDEQGQLAFKEAHLAPVRHLPLPKPAVLLAARASRAFRGAEQDPAEWARAQHEPVRPPRSEMEKRSPLAHGTEKVVARFEVANLTFRLIGGEAVADANLLGELRTSTRDCFQLRFREQPPLRAHLMAESHPFLSN
jgi:hypothetical protein